jgi:predicted TIM-barrel fold metal-dependent hydrolase
MLINTDHMCKPDLSRDNAESRARWIQAILRLAADANVYMKLSGLLNEFGRTAPTDLTDPAWERIHDYVPAVFKIFGIERLMFGSDWPVCNIGGPGDKSWGVWTRELVPMMLEWGRDVTKRDIEQVAEWVWWRAGATAYGIEM